MILFLFVLLIALLLFIVNNGNILADGRNERKYLQKKNKIKKIKKVQ